MPAPVAEKIPIGAKPPKLHKKYGRRELISMAAEKNTVKTGQRRHHVLNKCCLPHDLCYAFGEPDNEIERERVDLKFKSDLITKAGMEEWRASIFHIAVRIGGAEKLGRSFSWAFARRA